LAAEAAKKGEKVKAFKSGKQRRSSCLPPWSFEQEKGHEREMASGR